MLMFPVSMVHQAEIVQLDRWDHGPLELVFLDEAVCVPSHEMAGLVFAWNMGARGGFARQQDDLEAVQAVVPALRRPRPNPNVYLVPRVGGYTELHAMLASVVPDEILTRHGIPKLDANFWLVPHLDPFTEEVDRPYPREERLARQAMGAASYATAAIAAFTEFIWTKLARDRRWSWGSFAPDSPLRLLADDAGYWMSRLYRYAVECGEQFEEADHDSERTPLDELTRELHQSVPEEDRHNFVVRRARKGGRLWDRNDPEDCAAVVDEMLDGCDVLGSLNPVLEVLRTHHAPEDFSDRYSWVKEDFERSFYKKRAKLKVSLVETVDDLPAWSACEPEGHGDVLFRDLLAFFDRRDRHLLIAVRHGKTVSEIARELGHNGHAAVARRVQVIKDKLRRILG